MEQEHMKCVRPTIRKTLIKGTILLIIITPFLEVTPSKVLNYLIFVVAWYTLLAVYMLWKRMHIYCIKDGTITIRNLFRTREISKSKMKDCFISQGFLAKRFDCGSIYIIINDKIYILKDIPKPYTYYSIICEGARS